MSNADALYREWVVRTRTWNHYLLPATARMPDAQSDYFLLHPYEAAVFGINPDHWPELYSAFEWWQGAIGECLHNDFSAYREEEQARWKMGRKSGLRIQDTVDFLHRVTGYALRECTAFMMRVDAMENRSAAAMKYPDEKRHENGEIHTPTSVEQAWSAVEALTQRGPQKEPSAS